MEPCDSLLDGTPEGDPLSIAVDDGIPEGGIGKGQGVSAMPFDQRLCQFRDLCARVRHSQPSNARWCYSRAVPILNDPTDRGAVRRRTLHP
jgi:hypothetical protein